VPLGQNIMKIDSKKQEEKLIIKYVKELNKLNRICWNAPVIPLAKPYQNGWIKYFVLRDDYTRRTDANVYLTIIKEIGLEAFCRKQNFLDAKGREYSPGLRIIGKNEWDKLGWPDYYKKYFTYGIFRPHHCYHYNSTIEGYKFKRDFCFVHAIKPHFITHTRVIYPDIESRIDWINNLFKHKQYWRKYNHLKGSYNYEKDYTQPKIDFINKLSTKEIEEYDKSE
jgi:hypothetical protein